MPRAKLIFGALAIGVLAVSILMVMIIPTPVMTFMGGALVFLAPIALAAFFGLLALADHMRS